MSQKFVAVPKGPKLSGPPAKLARGSTEVRIPVKLVPAVRPRSVYISDTELDREPLSSSEATHTPKSVPPSPGGATHRRASRSSQIQPPPAPPKQKARPRSSSATPIAGSVVSEIRTGPNEFRAPYKAPWHFDHGPRNAFHAWHYAQWQEQQARGRAGSQPPPELSNPPPRHHHAEGSFKRPSEQRADCSLHRLARGVGSWLGRWE